LEKQKRSARCIQNVRLRALVTLSSTYQIAGIKNLKGLVVPLVCDQYLEMGSSPYDMAGVS
jgi:hypothetical protein